MESKGRLAFCIQNNHHMMPSEFFWSYLRMVKPSDSFAVEGNSSVKASEYNDSIYKALKLGAEWMFLMDVDQTFQVHTIPKLFDTVDKYDAKIVSVLYHLGRAPFGPVAGWFKEGEKETTYVNSDRAPWREAYAPLGRGVVEVDWVGSGGLLVHKSVIDAIGWPPFLDVWSPGKGFRDSGHDINFCVRAKEKGFKIYVDTDVKSDHFKMTGIGHMFAQAFHESRMLEHMDGILHRGTLEPGYWDTVWQMETIKGTHREDGYKETLSDLEKVIPAEATVADIGCGLGAVMEHLRDKLKCKCTGYDFSEEAIRAVKSKGFGGHVADLRHYVPNGDASTYDAVVSTHTIEHIADDNALVESMKSLCKPGGRVVIATPWREEIQGHFEHVRGYTDDELAALMKRHFNDFTIQKNNRDYVAVGHAA